jgi:hypothetical protein
MALLDGLRSLHVANPRSPLFEEEWIGDEPTEWGARLTFAEGSSDLVEL